MLTELNSQQKNITVIGLGTIGILTSWLCRSCPTVNVLVLGLVVFLSTGWRPTIVYSVVSTFRRDLHFIVTFIRFSLRMRQLEKGNLNVPMIFQSIVKKNPDKIAFIMDDRKFTFKEVDDYSNRIGSYFLAKGLQKGDTVALIMENQIEYPCIWLGLSKIGVITALINTNLRKATLEHSIRVASVKAIIVGSELTEPLNEVLFGSDNWNDVQVYQFNENDSSAEISKNYIDLKTELKTQVIKDLSEEISKVGTKDRILYIYTSGTTGLPKPAVITHLRYSFVSLATYLAQGIRDDDIIYNSLPLYHSAGGMLGVGCVLLMGVSMALRKKFSASNFWSDCIKYKCTVAQYIGEICRFLLSVPKKPIDYKHSVRLMFGNGLQKQLWTKFVDRFQIERIGEFYGSTEGNSNMANTDNTVGAVGFVPLFAKKIYPVTLIKLNEDTGEPILDSNGWCIPCKPGEAGMFIGQINPKQALRNFHGYIDKESSEKKILRNVFKLGDSYFNSGDILVQDIFGYFYFKDRTGDTYRWRGENVATSEVEAIISSEIGLKECLVYGVEIPHIEGKAGMAAIVDPNHAVDIEGLAKKMRESLPSYAQPLFIRILKQPPMTATFKLLKRDLQLEGIDISNKIKDDMYLLQKDGYKIFTKIDYENILSGNCKL